MRILLNVFEGYSANNNADVVLSDSKHLSDFSLGKVRLFVDPSNLFSLCCGSVKYENIIYN